MGLLGGHLIISNVLDYSVTNKTNLVLSSKTYLTELSFLKVKLGKLKFQSNIMRNWW